MGSNPDATIDFYNKELESGCAILVEYIEDLVTKSRLTPSGTRFSLISRKRRFPKENSIIFAYL